mgnify:CR=1 FL=1
MADNDANNTAAGATGSPKGGSPQDNPGLARIDTTGQPLVHKDSGINQAEPGILRVTFWPALILAVFIWMWRTGKIAGIRNYILETKEQLDKCTWPTWNELRQHIVVVLISSFLLAVFTVAADFVVREIVWGALMDSKTVLFNTKDL